MASRRIPRREFLKSASALVAGTALSTPAVWSAQAQSRKETLPLDRVPPRQMKAGTLANKGQCVAVDDTTFRGDFIKKDRVTIPDLAVIVASVYSAGLLKKTATDKDPRVLEYAKSNTAGACARGALYSRAADRHPASATVTIDA